MNNITELRKAYPELIFDDEKEEERLESLKLKKARGKGAPKKRRSAAGMFTRVLVGVGWMLMCDNRIEEVTEEETEGSYALGVSC
jgi:hypothetical protein